MTQVPVFRRAQARDAEDLGRVAFAAKAHWGYPAEWLAIWKPGLEPSIEDIETQWFLVCELESEVIGFVAVFLPRDDSGHPRRTDQSANGDAGVDAGVDAEIEHLWVRPDHMGRGIGRELVTRAARWAREQGIDELEIVSDPNACPFYESLGAKQIGRRPSEPAPRELPVLVLDLRRTADTENSALSRPRSERAGSAQRGDAAAPRKE